MEPKPAQESRQPAYPTRREVLAGAASFALISMTGQGRGGEDAPADKIVVAPIFEHGEGRGATGCVVVSPPVFLSEEEAVQIMREELAKHKITLKAGRELKGVRIAARAEHFEIVEKPDGESEFKESIVEFPDKAKPLRLDGLDPDKKIAVKFVSSRNYCDLGGPSSSSTVQAYELKQVAQQVATVAKEQAQDHVFFGVFYDPTTKLQLRDESEEGDELDPRAAWEKRRERCKDESEKLLRLQVQDFVDWLKKQKAI